MPGYTFIASLSSIIYSRAVPVLAEVDRTFNLDPDDVRAKITPRTRAIMAVHMMGNPARLDELKAIADEHGLLLIEDCAQAFGATYKGRPVGSIGHAGAFSFNVYKTITSGDGGMVVTDDEEVYRRCFAFHDQGHSPLRTGVEIGQRPFVGLDFRFTELQAAVLIAQFRKLPRIVSHLRANKRRYKELIADLPGLEFRELPDPEGDLATMLTVILPNEEVARRIATTSAPRWRPTRAGTSTATWSKSWSSGPSRRKNVRSPALRTPVGADRCATGRACCRGPTRCWRARSTSASASPTRA